MGNLETVFTPLRVNSLTLKNRLVMPPMHTSYGTQQGTVSQRLLDHYVRRAQGGVGLIIQEATSVLAEGKGAREWLGIWDDASIAGWRELVAAVHEGGAKMAIQLHHAGAVAHPKVTGCQPVAPWPWNYREPPRILTVPEIVAIENAFAAAAGRALAAGYDALEVHGGHGYLVTQFLSPLSNQRPDEYGGSVEGRTRFACNIVAKVRRVVGPEFPISFRISGDEFLPGGIGLEESRQIAAILVDAGVDILHVSGGRLPEANVMIGPMEVPHGNLVHLAAGIKQVVSVPVIAVGRITDVRMAEEVLQAGKADLVALGRALFADPDLPNKARQGRLDDIRPCIGCHQGCRGGAGGLSCLSNPEVGRDRELAVVSTAQPKKVVVIGGGPGGLEAARVAALRGHRVTLFEQEPVLGGRLRAGTVAPLKKDLTLLIDHLAGQVQKLGVDVRLNETATKSAVQAAGAQEVILAAGAEPVVPELAGVDRAGVVIAEDVLLGRAAVGQRVVVMGGGMTGCEVAEYLAAQGKQVTIVTRIESDKEIAGDLPVDRRRLLRARMRELGVGILMGTALQAILDGVVVVRHGEEEDRLPADSVVLAQGYRPKGQLAEDLRALGVPVHVIGDAKESRTAKEAIREGSEVGRAV